MRADQLHFRLLPSLEAGSIAVTQRWLNIDTARNKLEMKRET